MGEVRACAYIFLILVSCQLIAGKPFFPSLIYSLLCDYDDDPTSTTASYEDWFDYDICDSGPRPRRTTTPRPGQPPRVINMVIPPANGVNLTMTNDNGIMQIGFLPIEAAPATPARGAATTPTPGATAAPAAATTAAAPTAAAPTTAAAGK